MEQPSSAKPPPPDPSNPLSGDNPADPQRILDTALAMAEQHGWEALRLHQVAEQQRISLEQIRQHFNQKEALIDAWFDRADQSMLLAAAAAPMDRLQPLEQLELVMMAWFQALGPHQEVTRQMIEGKLEPGHLHIQFDGLLRVSRTVQWMREAAQRKAFFIHRAVEESVLTAIYLASFARWLIDHSDHFQQTRQGLRRRLAQVEPLLRRTQKASFAPLSNPFKRLKSAAAAEQ